MNTGGRKGQRKEGTQKKLEKRQGERMKRRRERERMKKREEELEKRRNGDKSSHSRAGPFYTFCGKLLVPMLLLKSWECLPWETSRWQ